MVQIADGATSTTKKCSDSIDCFIAIRYIHSIVTRERMMEPTNVAVKNRDAAGRLPRSLHAPELPLDPVEYGMLAGNVRVFPTRNNEVS